MWWFPKLGVPRWGPRFEGILLFEVLYSGSLIVNPPVGLFRDSANLRVQPRNRFYAGLPVPYKSRFSQ